MLDTVGIYTVISGDFEVLIEFLAVVTDGLDSFTGGSSKDAVFAPSHLTGFVETASDFKFGIAYGNVSFNSGWVVIDALTLHRRGATHSGDELAVFDMSAKLVAIREFGTVISPAIIFDVHSSGRSRWVDGFDR